MLRAIATMGLLTIPSWPSFQEALARFREISHIPIGGGIDAPFTCPIFARRTKLLRAIPFLTHIILRLFKWVIQIYLFYRATTRIFKKQLSFIIIVKLTKLMNSS